MYIYKGAAPSHSWDPPYSWAMALAIVIAFAIPIASALSTGCTVCAVCTVRALCTLRTQYPVPNTLHMVNILTNIRHRFGPQSGPSENSRTIDLFLKWHDVSRYLYGFKDK